jgi:hypothetical protein
MSIDLFGNALWRAPVLIRIGYGSSEQVASPSVALDYLQNRWPHERGSHYAKAITDCKTASEGQIPHEVARETFIAAAIESRVLAS